MQSPRWHDLVIVLAILTLTVVGAIAIWGEEIASLFDPGSETEQGETAVPRIDPAGADL